MAAWLRDDRRGRFTIQGASWGALRSWDMTQGHGAPLCGHSWDRLGYPLVAKKVFSTLEPEGKAGKGCGSARAGGEGTALCFFGL